MAKKIALSILVLFSLYLLFPFLGAVGMGAIFAVLFYPWMKRIDRGRFPNSLAAGLFMFGVTTVIFLPVTTIMIGSVKSGLVELKRIKRLDRGPTEAASSEAVLENVFSNSGFEAFLEKTSTVLPFDPAQVSNLLKELITTIAVRMGDALSHFIGGIPEMAVSFVVFLFSMYYFLAGGGNFVRNIRANPYFARADIDRIFTAFSGICRSVILASIVTGGLQAMLATGASLAFGIRQPLLVFAVTFISSFIPLLGSFPVMMGMAIFQLVTGHAMAGLGLAICAPVIGMIDNLVGPQIVRGGSNMHPLLVFISALGGLQVFGMSGVFLGPVICGMTVEIVKIAQGGRNLPEAPIAPVLRL